MHAQPALHPPPTKRRINNHRSHSPSFSNRTNKGSSTVFLNNLFLDKVLRGKDLLGKVLHASSNTTTSLNTTFHLISALVLQVGLKDFHPMDILLCHMAPLHLAGILHQDRGSHTQIRAMSMDLQGNLDPRVSRQCSKVRHLSQILLLKHHIPRHSLPLLTMM